MIDAIHLGRNQHIKATLDTDGGSLELELDHSASDVRLTPDEVYDLFSWLYNCHRDLLVFQVLRADILSKQRAALNVDNAGLTSQEGQLPQTTVCFSCQQESRIRCEICKTPLCHFHRREVNGYFSVRRYLMCDACVSAYQNFIGSNRHKL